MKVVCIIQARMGSTRLPGKVLMPLQGQPAILRMLDRIDRTRTLSEVWVATGDDAGNDRLAETLKAGGRPVFRGSEPDVLDRYWRLATDRKADVVVRLTGDCPLHDASVVDAVVERFLAASDNVEYASNCFPPSWPNGLETEVFSYNALDRVARNSHNRMEREFVTIAIHRQYHRYGPKPQIANIEAPAPFSHLRWTLDYPEDYEFIRKTFDALLPTKPDFGWLDVVSLQTARPELLEYSKVQKRNANFLALVEAGGLEEKA